MPLPPSTPPVNSGYPNQTGCLTRNIRGVQVTSTPRTCRVEYISIQLKSDHILRIPIWSSGIYDVTDVQNIYIQYASLPCPAIIRSIGPYEYITTLHTCVSWSPGRYVRPHVDRYDTDPGMLCGIRTCTLTAPLKKEG